MLSLSLATDPRPDLKQDHRLWGLVLVEAYRYCMHKPDLFEFVGNLHGVRCGGARLLRRPNGSLKLIPGEWKPDEWNRITAKYLAPYKEDLKAIFQLVSDKIAEYTRERYENEHLEQVQMFR